MAATFILNTDCINQAATKRQGKDVGEIHLRGVITFDASYPTGGETITTAIINAGLAADGQITALKRVIPSGRNYSAGTHFGLWNDTDEKLLLFVEDGTSGVSAQVANTTDVSTVAIPVTVICSPPI